jgi:glycyl-tRNA synthetase beta chain
LDTLVGFFAIDEKPTGSKDPFALRRAALGVIRLLSSEVMNLRAICLNHANQYFSAHDPKATIDALMAFFLDRLAVVLHDQDGFQREWIAAAFATVGKTELPIHRLRAKVAALSAFLGGYNGTVLLAGYRRANKLLKDEEKASALPNGPAERLAGAPDEEVALFDALNVVRPKVELALANDYFEDAMTALSELRAPVDAFFDKVFVNDPNSALRDNRLRLLASVRATMEQVADFNLING